MGIIRLIKNATNTKESRGTFGEMIVASIFDSRFFGDEEHYLINDVVLETSDGKTHQIDHVAIYKTGIFCIETKNIEGLIKGRPKDRNWRIYSGNKPYELFNPIRQNKKHVAVLSEFINWRHDVHSIIVFIKGNKPSDCTEEVINLQELKDYIKKHLCKKEITSMEMKTIFELLSNYKNESGIVHKITG